MAAHAVLFTLLSLIVIYHLPFASLVHSLPHKCRVSVVNLVFRLSPGLNTIVTEALGIFVTIILVATDGYLPFGRDLK